MAPVIRGYAGDVGIAGVADITVFDPAKIIDGATYAQPNQASQGIEYVLVNGHLEYEQGRLTGAIAGRPLRGTARHTN